MPHTDFTLKIKSMVSPHSIARTFGSQKWQFQICKGIRDSCWCQIGRYLNLTLRLTRKLKPTGHAHWVRGISYSVSPNHWPTNQTHASHLQWSHHHWTAKRHLSVHTWSDQISDMLLQSSTAFIFRPKQTNFTLPEKNGTMKPIPLVSAKHWGHLGLNSKDKCETID